MATNFHSNGKLLLTGEYLVLDGAKALAIPTKLGQSMKVSENETGKIHWKSFDKDHNIWFETLFSLEKGKITNTREGKVSENLQKILQYAIRLNPEMFSEKKGFDIDTHLEFPQHWGLGSSSTLINNLANWLNIDPYSLLENTLGGSGYDLACAQTNSPISYQLTTSGRIVQTVHFDPPFKKNLFFVHLNRKQDSREAIAHYRNQPKASLSKAISKVSEITEQLIVCQNLEGFESLLTTHENLLSSLLQIPTVKTRLFKDYPKAIKSLGGWGGDFILAVGEKNDQEYFRKKGFETIVSYEEMV